MPARSVPIVAAFAALSVLAACAGPVSQTRMGPDGRPLPVVYRISSGDARVQTRMIEALNTLRQANGFTPVVPNAQLASVAATQARSISDQARPWHFGADGSSPIERAARVGYTGQFLGELLSETYETELETLTAWMGGRETRPILMDPRANEVGFAWHQDGSGKLWWVMALGAAN